MKNFYSFVCLLLPALILAQIPSGYYNTATGSGYTLKTQLHNIIDDHDAVPYSEIDDFFMVADRDSYYENDNTILDPYSENPTGTDPYNYSFTNAGDQCGNYDSEGDCYNAEHVIPQSIYSQNEPMRGDAHQLLPTDGRVNGFRSNYPYSIVGTLISQSGISNPTMNGSKLGQNLNSGISSGYSGVVFEPIDAFKGDIARIYFYFATRYQDVVGSFSSYPMFDGTSTKTIADPFLNVLLTWHFADPVSQKEIDRNNAIYSYQGNRNPYIDHPEYVCMVWSNNCALDTPEHQIAKVVVYPVPSSGSIWVSSAGLLSRVRVISIIGQVLHDQTSEPTTEVFISNLPRGVHILEISGEYGRTFKKIVIE